MRCLSSLITCALIAAPAAASAQAVAALPTAMDLGMPANAPTTLAPLPTLEPTAPAPPPVVARPAPAPVVEATTPLATSEPTTLAPDIVAKPEKEGLGDKLGTMVGGVAGGAAGAAVAGPLGKFAGGFIGRKLVQGVLGGDNDDVPKVTAVARAPSVEDASTPAMASPATAPPLKEAISDQSAPL